MGIADKLDEHVTQFGFALFVPEQPGCGVRRNKDLNPWQKLSALRQRAPQTAKEIRQLIDIVEKRIDIDSQRIYL